MTDRHLDPDIIARATSGHLSEEERAGMLAHAESCAPCRADLTYVIGFERRRRKRRAVAIVATVASAVLATSILPLSPTPSVTSLRSGDEGVPLVTTHQPVNGAEVTGDSIAFVWENVGPDTHYRLQLSTAAGLPILDRALRDTSSYVAVESPLEVGETYLWLVDALLADGGSARSRVWRFTIRE